MSCIAFPCEYDRSEQFRIHDAFFGDFEPDLASLHDLIGSDESFISHLEAIHYLSFPGF